MMTDHELSLLAAYMFDTHGMKALEYADTAAEELEQVGELLRADAWRALKVFVIDMAEGRRSREGNILH